MSHVDVQRLRNDLETVRQAAGLNYPYTRAHVAVKAAFALSALAATIWAWLAHDLAAPFRLVGFAALLFTPCTVYAR